MNSDMIMIGVRGHESSSNWRSRELLVNVFSFTETRINLTYPDGYDPSKTYTYRKGQINLVPVDFIERLNSL